MTLKDTSVTLPQLQKHDTESKVGHLTSKYSPDVSCETSVTFREEGRLTPLVRCRTSIGTRRQATLREEGRLTPHVERQASILVELEYLPP